MARVRLITPGPPPALVAFPVSAGEVRRIVNLCRERHWPVIPFGVGPSLEGHTGAI